MLYCYGRIGSVPAGHCSLDELDNDSTPHHGLVHVVRESFQVAFIPRLE